MEERGMDERGIGLTADGAEGGAGSGRAASSCSNSPSSTVSIIIRCMTTVDDHRCRLHTQ